MAKPAQDPIGARYLQRRVEKKGLKPRYAASLIAILWLIAIVVFGVVEHLIDKDSFHTVWQGMWWATQTVTTVGYGDVVPSDPAGRFIATILMVGGLSLFAVVTGTITSAFVTRAQERNRAGADALLEDKIDALTAEVAALREQLGRQD
jgi:voltage-gated potassium channel